MNAVIDKPQARAAKAPVTPRVPTSPMQQYLPKVKNLSALIHTAWMNEGGSDITSGESERLLRMAFNGAEALKSKIESDATFDKEELESHVYDVAALVKASLRVPDDKTGPGRLALIQEAGILIEELTEDQEAMTYREPPQPSPRRESFVTDVWSLVCEAEAVLRTDIEGPNPDTRTNGLWGAMSLMGTAAIELERFLQPKPSYDDCMSILCSLQQVIGILEIFGRQEESLILNACSSLIGMAEDFLKAGMETLSHG